MDEIDDWRVSLKSQSYYARQLNQPLVMKFDDYYHQRTPAGQRITTKQVTEDEITTDWNDSNGYEYWSNSQYGVIQEDRIETPHRYNLTTMSGMTRVLNHFEYHDKVALSNVLINSLSAITHRKSVTYTRRREKIVGKNISTYRVRNAVDYLHGEGYLEVRVGISSTVVSYRRPSSYTPTDKMVDLFSEHGDLINKSMEMINKSETVVILRGTDKKDKPIPRNKKHLIEEMQRINTNNDKFVLKIDGKILNTRGVRIFNENMECGGRIYRTDVLQLLSEDRLRIEVDGERICEIDYISMHPRILFNMKNIHVPIDAYSMMFDGEYDKNDRDLVKTALNVLINSKSRKQAVGVLTHEMRNSESRRYTCPDHLLDEMYQVFHQISEYFLTGIGRKLQKIDSDIAVSVKLAMSEIGKLCVGCHDSFITKRVDREILMRIMSDTYRDKLGYGAPIMTNIMVGDIKISEVHEL